MKRTAKKGGLFHAASLTSRGKQPFGPRVKWLYR
jgi:hypothetical protein